jgi:hypothetical protein
MYLSYTAWSIAGACAILLLKRLMKCDDDFAAAVGFAAGS